MPKKNVTDAGELICHVQTMPEDITSKEGRTGYTFIVDPIDGTSN